MMMGSSRVRACVRQRLASTSPDCPDQVGQYAIDFDLCLIRIRSYRHTVARMAQVDGYQLGNRRLILDHQYTAHPRLPVV